MVTALYMCAGVKKMWMIDMNHRMVTIVMSKGGDSVVYVCKE